MVARLVIAAPASGSGKTTVATGLMAAFAATGLAVSPHKVGPDYIDPGYHSLACGRPGRNLDAYLCGPEQVAPLFAHGAAGCDVAVVEGVMGLYDGASGLGELASTAQVAKLLRAPVVLVVDASSQSRSVAALVHGFVTWDPEVRIGGVILNKVGSHRHEELLREALEAVGVPVFGALRRGPAVSTPSRHLGLVPVAERSAEAVASVAAMAALVRRDCDLAGLLALARSAPGLRTTAWSPFPEPPDSSRPRVATTPLGAAPSAGALPPLPRSAIAGGAGSPDAGGPARTVGPPGLSVATAGAGPTAAACEGPEYAPAERTASVPSAGGTKSAPPAIEARGFGGRAPAEGAAPGEGPQPKDARQAVIAVAGGAAFTFGYAEHPELLRAHGAEVVAFDPLRDEALPEGTSGIVIGGGFPEVYADELSANEPLRRAVAAFARRGGPVVAECAGLLYLTRSLDGQPMCGVLDAEARMAERLTLGYRDAVAVSDSALAAVGTRMRGHEFHRTVVEPGTGPTPAWGMHRPVRRTEGFVQQGVHASYLHVHWAAEPAVARRLVERCTR
ncbi:cobyrinate a,c-diamide synthase [Streptomyces sp. NPDC048057]|uniref:cobyrinate a,c-diamide synthase n=1 Tax=Streptomyces sp. NPDC048057 TaxID=3155628 RepID=UPI0033EF527B